MNTKVIPPQAQKEILSVLANRFMNNKNRHPKLIWEKIQQRLISRPTKLWSLAQMEKSGGEPDLVEENPQTNEYIFFECSPESPKGRRSLCYDRLARTSRKEHPPKSSVAEVAESMGVKVLDETQYRYLQTLGEFDTKTSSWLNTPTAIRQLGGAIFADRRYNQVFVYHNGAESYYASRGARFWLEV